MAGKNRRKSYGREYDKWKKKGFMTVELIIVIVLVMILAGGLVFGVSYWITKINFDRQNEYARALYAAAQNQLTEYSTSGQMDSLQSALQDGNGDYKTEYRIGHGKADVTDLKGADGVSYDLDILWPESSGKTSPEKYRDQICSLKGTPDDYAKYLEEKNGTSGSGTSLDGGTRALYAMLDSYLYDTEILSKGVVCVEFTPEDGQVFAVLYSDKATDFTYTHTEDRKGIVSISSREVNYRKARMVGYYGVDTLYKATSTKLERPTIRSLKLNNEDTLNLSFQIGKVTGAEQELNYEIIVCNNEEKVKKKQERLIFVLAGNQLKNKQNRQTVPCEVTRYLHETNGSGEVTTKKQYIGTYNILAWLEPTSGVGGTTSPVIRIVLDAADTAALTDLYKDAYPTLLCDDELTKESYGSSGLGTDLSFDELRKTLSFHRFGLTDVEEIYCSVRAKGENYTPAALKKSNSEHVYFGSHTSTTLKENHEKSVTTETFTIRNGRHLYNVRYLEDYTEAQYKASVPVSREALLALPDNETAKRNYLINEDFDWALFAETSLFEKGAEDSKATNDLLDQDKAFPSIRQLQATSVLKSPNERNIHTVTGLDITAAGNRDADLYLPQKNGALTDKEKALNKDTNEANQSAGLFLVNYGTIKDLAVDQIQVKAGKNVGAFCGINKGMLDNLTVRNTDQSKVSRIQGVANVGGIAGTHAFVSEGETSVLGDQKVTFKDLENYADVTERAHDMTENGESPKEPRTGFGGIFGSLTANSAENAEITVESAQNYGKVYAQDKHSFIVEDVNHTETCAVGGIVGITEASKAGQIILKQCSSSPQYTEEDVRQIFSSESGQSQTDAVKARLKGKYVGGIVGYNNNAAILKCNTKKQTNAKEGYVFGMEYVGGIVGYNEASADSTQIDGTTSQHTEGRNQAHVVGVRYVGGIVGGNPSGQITNWTNEGFVGALEAYAGGITGYNGSLPGQNIGNSKTAKIENCKSAVVNSSTVRTFRQQESLKSADYTGGIAGYNDATIKSDKKIAIVSSVTGKNYVGGVVGYNDVHAVVENYDVTGGYVEASGSYVGGYCGLNASVELLMRGETTFNIKSNPNLVKGYSCVGGVIGGNIVPVSNDNTINCQFLINNFLGKLDAEGAFAGGFIGYNCLVKDTMGFALSQDENDALVKVSIQKAAGASVTQLEEIRKKESSAELAGLANPQEIFGSIKPLSNGIDNAELYLSGAIETAPVQVRFAGVSAQIYVGGVMGYNDGTKLTVEDAENKTPVTARKCVASSNREDKDYKGKAKEYSYAGGIIGMISNEITIINCSNKDDGKVVSKGTYTGGLCEVNEGTIRQCSAGSLGSSGMDYVGGIAGVNRQGGKIIDCSLDESGKSTTITGSNYVGGIVAENYGTIKGVSIHSSRSAVRAYGSTGCVGGIAGYNYAWAKIELDGNQNLYVDIDSAGKGVGGVAGVNEGTITLQTPVENNKLTVRGRVTGADHVGGVVGENITSNPLANYTNQAKVMATGSGALAGGIAGITSGNITNCENSGKISAQAGGACAGGIVAINQNGATISGCINRESVEASNGLCGGIVAKNGSESGANATIINCQVESANQSRLEFKGWEKAGGICAVNSGVIKNSQVKGIILNDLAESRESMLGGIAAENCLSAEIKTCSVENTDVISYSTGGSHGGVAGINAGTISGERTSQEQYTSVSANLKFIKHATTYFGNLGGVAGKNTGTIVGYRFSGKVEGTANNPQNPPQYDPTSDQEQSGAVIYGYGGIAGVNETSGEIPACIRNCEVTGATITGIGDATNIVNVGGVAGVNGKKSEISSICIGNGDPLNENKLKNNQWVPRDIIQPYASYNVYIGAESYGHTGGIAGMNAGEIHSIKGSSSAVDGISGSEDQSQWMAPSYGDLKGATVLIENNRGHVGGITGYNRRTGMVSGASTGADWVVYAPKNASDNGCGGIIGYQAGERGLSRCTNAAKVVKDASNSNGVGGMIGRMEVATARNYLIQDCTNYGMIYGHQRVGGMVGIAKYYGGTLSRCVNYGKIKSNSIAAGGMIGHLYSMTRDYGAVSMTSCANHGTVEAQNNAGGIVGHSSLGDPRVYVEDCVNTGLIKISETSETSRKMGGIIGTSGLDYQSEILNCRNYGYVKDAGDGIMYGIAPIENAKIRINNCFGVANLSKPIANRTVSGERNYYITEKSGSGSEEVPFYVESISAPQFIQKEQHLHKIVSGNTDADLADGDRAWFRTDKANEEWYYEFTFSKVIELSEINLYWNRDTNKRWYNYIISYSASEEGEYQEVHKTEYKFYTDAVQDSLNPQKETITFGNSVKAKRIKIVITDSHGNTINTKLGEKQVNAALIRAHFTGTCDETEVKDFHQKEYGGGAYPFKEEFKQLNYTFATADGKDTASFKWTSKVNGAGQNAIGAVVAPYPDENGGQFQLKVGEKTVGLPGFSIDPYKTLKSKESETYTDENLAAVQTVDNNIRYTVYERIDKYLVADAVLSEVGLNKPTGVSLSSDSGNMKAEWRTVDPASCYEYVAEYYSADSETPILTRSDRVYRNNVDLPVCDINGKKVAKITFKVRAAAVTLVEGNPGWIYSDYSDKCEASIQSTLPVPEYHLELIQTKEGEKNVLKYQAILDNQEEYRTFVQNQSLGEVSEAEMNQILENIQIQVTGSKDNLSLTFTVKEGKSSTYWNGSDGNIMFTAQATYHDPNSKGSQTFSDSPKSIRESAAWTNSVYTGGVKVANIYLADGDRRGQGIGFRGSTADTLQYRAQLLNYGDGQNKVRSTAFYMRTELTAVTAIDGNQTVKIPVSLSSSEVRISDVMQSAINTELTPLPTNLMNPEYYDNLMVRSYPTLMSNNIVYNGHNVDLTVEDLNGADGVDGDVLNELYVTDDNQVTKTQGGRKLITTENGSSKLAPGFVVIQNPNGKYSLYYNTLLAYNEENSSGGTSQGDDASDQTKMSNQVYCYKISRAFKMQPVPEIAVNPLTDEKDDYITTEQNGKITIQEGDPNADEMIVVWDQKDISKTAYGVGAEYDYTVTGITSAGESVLIETGKYITKDGEISYQEGGVKTGPNKLILDAASWNYQKVQISISRRGKTDMTGVTTLFPSGEEKEVLLRARFSQIEGPVVVLHSDESGVQKNALDYDVEWNEVPQSQRDELAFYEVKVGRNAADQAAVWTFDTEEECQAKLEKLRSLYKEKSRQDGLEKKSSDEGVTTITWSWEETGSDETVICKVMILKLETVTDSGSTVWKITGELTEAWRFPVSDDSSTDGSTEIPETSKMTRTVDLSDFERGEALQISVRAIAKEDAQTYRDGQEGVITEMTLPSRLEVPNVALLKLKNPYNKDSFITIEELDRGLDVLYQTEQSSDEAASGAYELAIAVYQYNANDEENQTDMSQVLAGDGREDQTGYWDSGAWKVIASKERPLMMEGSLNNASVLVNGLVKEYGGSWMKVAMRKISDSNISSWWSDEDEATAGTQNYRWLRIPRVQEETPGVENGSSPQPYQYNSVLEKYIFNKDSGQGPIINVQQETVSFDTTDLADSYQIEWIRRDEYAGQWQNEDVTTDDSVKHTDWIYLEREETQGEDTDMYHVFYAATDPNYNPEERQKVLKSWSENNDQNVPTSSLCEDAIYIGTVAADPSAVAEEVRNTLPERVKDTLILPYKKEIAYEEETSIEATALLKCESRTNGKTTFTFVLPDTESIEEVQQDSEFTDQISVTGVIGSEKKMLYEDSRICHLYRTETGWEEKEIIKKEEAPVVKITETMIPKQTESEQETPLTEAMREGPVYTLDIGGTDKWVALKVKLTDQSNANPDIVRYVSSYGRGELNISKKALLPLGRWIRQAEWTTSNADPQAGDAATYQVKIEIQVITIERVTATEPMSGGLSKWSEWCTLKESESVVMRAAAEEVTDTESLLLPTDESGEEDNTEQPEPIKSADSSESMETEAEGGAENNANGDVSGETAPPIGEESKAEDEEQSETPPKEAEGSPDVIGQP